MRLMHVSLWVLKLDDVLSHTLLSWLQVCHGRTKWPLWGPRWPRGKSPGLLWRRWMKLPVSIFFSSPIRWSGGARECWFLCSCGGKQNCSFYKIILHCFQTEIIFFRLYLEVTLCNKWSLFEVSFFIRQFGLVFVLVIFELIWMK